MEGAPTVLAAFVAGLLTAASPCVLAAMPVAVGFVAGQGASRRRALAITLAMVAGMTAALTLLGLVAARTGAMMGGLPAGWNSGVGALVIALGVWIGWGVAPQVATVPPALYRRLTGVPGAIVLGALLGTVMTPCATPALAAALVAAGSTSLDGSLLQGALLLGAYGVGHSALLLAAGPSLEVAARLARHAGRFERYMPGRRVFGAAAALAGGWLVLQAA